MMVLPAFANPMLSNSSDRVVHIDGLKGVTRQSVDGAET
jgi:hypothetical protein